MNSLRKKYGVLIAAIVGSILAILPMPICLELMGGGHGSWGPTCLFYGPVALVWFFVANLLTNSAPVMSLLLMAALCMSLYAGYAVLLHHIRNGSRPGTCLAAIAASHYACFFVVIMFLSLYGNESRENALSVMFSSGIETVLGIILFLGLNIAAIVYAVSGHGREKLTDPLISQMVRFEEGRGREKRDENK